MDSKGLVTGTKNTVLEVFPYLSKASNGTDPLGNSNYYKNYIFNNSNWIYAVDPPDYANTNSTWGLPLANTSFATFSNTATVPITFTLSGGNDTVPTDVNLVNVGTVDSI